MSDTWNCETLREEVAWCRLLRDRLGLERHAGTVDRADTIVNALADAHEQATADAVAVLAARVVATKPETPPRWRPLRRRRERIYAERIDLVLAGAA